MIDALPLIDLRVAPDDVARGIGEACRAHGFFYLVNHGIVESLGQRLEALSHRFFDLPEATKARYAMPLGGRAWRGWFPLGGELTSGRPDWKEGLYLGTELDASHPRVAAGMPMHGPNLLPGDDVLPGFRTTVLEWMRKVTALGHRVMEGIVRSIDLPVEDFARRYTADRLDLFRIFCYPSRPIPAGLDVRDGVGEHTADGLLRCCARTTSAAYRCTRARAGCSAGSCDSRANFRGAFMQWLDPWTDESDDDESASAFAGQLAREVAPGHPLFGQRVRLIARGADDDALFALLDGTSRVVVVHLTWARAPQAPPWPHAEFHDDLAAFARVRMHEDHAAVQAALARSDGRPTPPAVAGEPVVAATFLKRDGDRWTVDEGGET